MNTDFDVLRMILQAAQDEKQSAELLKISDAVKNYHTEFAIKHRFLEGTMTREIGPNQKAIYDPKGLTAKGRDFLKSDLNERFPIS